MQANQMDLAVFEWENYSGELESVLITPAAARLCFCRGHYVLLAT